MKYKLTFALVASLTSTAFAAFQAPLPEFKNDKQLAEWRAEKASEATSKGYSAEETAFYTGKPYLASSGGYAFKYRSYKPEVARWTSEDPSGFPDGANGNIYAATPTSSIDFSGLWKVYLTSIEYHFEDTTGNVSDMGVIYETVYKLSYNIDAGVNSVTGYATATAQDYNRFTGGTSGATRYGAGQTTVNIGFTSDGYLTADLPSGSANTEDDVSGGISMTGVGFDGKSKLGTVTVQVNAAYKGTVTYNATLGGLGYTPQSHAQSLAVTKSFVFQIFE